MRIELRIPTQLAERMRADLAGPNPLGGERVGFMMTRSAAASDTLVLTAHDYRPVVADAYIPADDVGVRIGTEAIRKAMEWGIVGQQGIWHVHAHAGRGQPPTLSSTDEADIPRLVEALTRSCPAESHGLFVVNADRASAEAWVPGHGRLPVVVIEVGWPLSQLSGWPSGAPNRKYARQSFLGPEAEGRLRGSRVGIVGAGGGGSHVFQQLAHLGVGDLTVFDPDVLEDTNLPRTVGATEQDVVDRQPKVEIARRMARATNRSASVRAYPARWQDHAESLRRCNIVVGAVDTFAARRELEATCRRFLIPYIDIGMDVFAGTKPVFRMAGQVIASIPGGPCMWCVGFLTEERMAQEARTYGAAGGRPQVVWANGVLASTAVGLAVDLITGWTGNERPGHYLSFDGNAGLINEHPQLGRAQGICRHFPLAESGLPVFTPLSRRSSPLETHESQFARPNRSS